MAKTVADQFTEILSFSRSRRRPRDHARGPERSRHRYSTEPHGPVLVDAVVNRTELAMPPTVTFELAKGFTLYMVNAVIGGRGDELIDLARTNLRR